MPLNKKTRNLYEAAIITYLILKAEHEKGAYSEELVQHLKQLGYIAAKSPKQVSMICRGLKIRGVIISELKRNTYWRISPDFFTIRPKWGINRDFYKTHKRNYLFPSTNSTRVEK